MQSIKSNEPYNRKRERGVEVYEQRRDLVLVVEYQTIPPCNDRAREGPMGEAVAGGK